MAHTDQTIIVYAPKDSVYNKSQLNKGWLVSYQMTPSQLYDYQPLMTDGAVAIDKPNGMVQIYDDLDTFQNYKKDLIKNKILGPGKVITSHYSDINRVLSQKARSEKTAINYLTQKGMINKKEEAPKTSVTFFINETDRKNPDPTPEAVVFYIADEELFEEMPEQAPTFYSTHDAPAVVLTNDEYMEMSNYLFDEYQFGSFRSRYFTNELEMFKGAVVKPRNEFVVPRKNQDEFYITSDDGSVEKVRHNIASGTQSEYGEDLAIQEAVFVGHKARTTLTYNQLNRLFRPATIPEIQSYKQRAPNILDVESNAAKYEPGSLVGLAASVSAGIANETKKEVFKTPEGQYRLHKVPDTIQKYWTKDKDKNVFGFMREDLIRVLKIAPDFPLPTSEEARISHATIWFNDEGVQRFIANLEQVPNVNDRSKNIIPNVVETGKPPTSRFKSSVDFHPHFLQRNTLSPGATVAVNGRTAVFEFYNKVKNPDDFIVRLKASGTGSTPTKEVLLPSSFVPESGVLINGSDTYKAMSERPAMKSVYEVTFKDGDKAWYKGEELFNRITAPNDSINPEHSSKMAEAFKPPVANSETSQSDNQKVALTEAMTIFGEDLSEAENDAYDKELVDSNKIIRKPRVANKAELEEAGQLALFGSAEDTLATHGKLVMSKAEIFKEKASQIAESRNVVESQPELNFGT